MDSKETFDNGLANGFENDDEGQYKILILYLCITDRFGITYLLQSPRILNSSDIDDFGVMAAIMNFHLRWGKLNFVLSLSRPFNSVNRSRKPKKWTVSLAKSSLVLIQSSFLEFLIFMNRKEVLATSSVFKFLRNTSYTALHNSFRGPPSKYFSHYSADNCV